MHSEGRAWTVMTWNIQGRRSTDLERVATVVAAAAPDVVTLQEVRRPQARQLADALGMHLAWVEKHNAFRPLFPSRAEGAAILTPHELREADHERVSDASSMRSYRRRILQWAVVERADRSAIRVFNLHLSPHDMADQRRTEAERTAAIAARFGPTPPEVFAGDFNDAGTTEIVDRLPGVDADSPPTNPSIDPVQRLDHVVVPDASSGVIATAPEGGVDWARLSDHLPLTVRFTLDDGHADHTA